MVVDNAIRGRLDASGRERLAKVLLLGYPTRDRFDALLDFGLDLRPADYPGRLDTAVRSLVTEMNADSGIARLLEAAAARCGNIDLKALHDEYFALVDPRQRGRPFEELITSIGFVNLDEWLSRGTHIKSQVCLVDTGRGRGTGFLIGPDLVMTNYHVVEHVINLPNRVRLFFDYYSGPEHKTTNRRELASDWLVAHSRYSAADLDETGSAEPGSDELDYVVLRTKERVAEEETTSGSVRGWQRLSEACTVAPESPLVIIQHPQGRPMQMAIDTSAVIQASATRARYRTNTLAGASGAPCFDLQWTLVALHQSGDPGFKTRWNQGISMAAIARSLKAAGLEMD